MAAERKHLPLPQRQRRRAAIALVLAPLATAFLITVMIVLIALSSGGSGIEFRYLLQGWFSLGVVATGLMLLIAWPFHAVAFRRRWRTAPTYVLAGGGAGIALTTLTAAVLALSSLDHSRPQETQWLGTLFGLALLFVLPSFIAAWIFWLIRRPDRDRDVDPSLVFE